MQCAYELEAANAWTVSIETEIWNFQITNRNEFFLTPRSSNWKRTEKQPFYSVLTTQADSRYVAQENIELVAGKFQATFHRFIIFRINENDSN